MAQRDRDRLVSRYSDENPLRVLIITMSDRAHSGEYADEGGPAIQQALDDHFSGDSVSTVVECVILPDDRDALEARLIDARDAQCDLIITTGGTGVGPRDITPDVVLALADKVIPGIMEVIRVKYGMEKPLAALSRTVAGVMGTTLVYTLPGSPKGVSEYMTEILKTLDHVLCVVHGIDQH